MLGLLEILVSWPIVLLVVVIIIRRQLPDISVKLADRLRKAGPVEFAEIRDKVDHISRTVKRLEEAAFIQPSAALTPDAKRRLETLLSQFYDYFKALGFKPSKGKPELSVRSNYDNAYYDDSHNLMVIGEGLLVDKDAPLHEYTLHVLASTAPEPHSKNGRQTYQEIELGLADYFPCSFTDNAQFGAEWARQRLNKPYLRNLENERRFTDIAPSRQDPHDAGEVWAGAFWEMRRILKQAVADKLLYSVWAAQSPTNMGSNDPEEFVRRLTEAAQNEIDSDASDTIRSVFQRRDLESLRKP